MTMHALNPFRRVPPVSVSGAFKPTRTGVRLRFQLGDPEKIVVNTLRDGTWDAASVAREDGLWKTTCFEAFWAEPGSAAYWELNLSPKGAWQLYRFTAERTPQPPQANDDYALLSLRTTPTELICELRGPADNALEVSLCAVIETAEKAFYYSTHHAGPHPDFHRRDSFVLRCQP